MNSTKQFAIFLATILASALVVADPAVRVVGLFTDAALVTIDGQRHMLKVGLPGRDGVELLSSDSRGATLRVNGEIRDFGLQPDYSVDNAEPTRQRVVIPKGAGGHYRISGSINGQGVPFMLDTGATSVAMNSNQARRLGIDYKVVGTRVSATTASGQVSAYKVRLDRVKVGDIELTNIEGLVLDGGFPTEVLLGMSYLSRVRMDDQRTSLILERRF
ncbi:MAG TPA: TIGR02281 family clan AA aspartic protease [Pseudomonas xinjiangensis]|uniref:TIGR02281 family clan AA aspartic protease n=2 Tax=root TaxID=1 RepID=A0A7V1FTF4_9GAMM|nr:TIGR02281 family clan AA aspartic protease [Halopseudomonas xinjiangensis]HEC48869.1 TIGR02281 family clan AA aspartic protease [Halopseudomonas xinjiangensis]